eukprot:CAMPEP_0117853028 /NCGR_PEP_ID=MMETSP0949-20121206/23434_1 /TAXON_ID=44440 /ORGANISM="Chattonella subsalsa, Strain CCMP2191" /LENGTH=221 /DNA_ID=CAMNT_0005701325 /DNA_START=57 /DNA_END=717 /DNA_ORIENTATION=+
MNSKAPAVIATLIGSACAFQPAQFGARTSTALAAKREAVPFLDKPDCLDGSLAGDVGFDPLKLSEIDFDFSKLVVPFSTEERAGLEEAVPFLDKPDCLDGSLAGDVGFDPLKLSEIDFDFSKLVVPFWTEERAGLSTLYWMREAEIKHARVCMMAVAGYLAVDMGLRFPGAKYYGHTALSAHDDMVASGNMGFLLLVGFGLELMSGVALYEAAKGSGREAG